jgi:uncharacterized surface protein with fasciclin (FAS1) repeats
MKSRKSLLLVLLVMMLSVVLAACSTTTPAEVEQPEVVEPTAEPVMEEPTEVPMEEEMSETIVDIAVADGRFTTLVTAVTAAGLAETLSGEGPFTVFAPTDDAFAALPEGTIEALLEDPQGALTDVLTYHVVEGAVMAETVVTLESAKTVSGENVSITVNDDGVFLNDTVKVIITDIVASNGVIHVIDGVLLPSSMMAEEEMSETIVDIAVADGRFTTLVTAVTEAGLVETLSGEGPFTVFAPTDDAFAALPEGTIPALLEDPQGALTDVLLYHVVEGAVMAETVVTLDSAMTVGGEEVSITVNDDGVFLNDSVQVIITDIVASNGVIHVIDAVLLPPSMMTEEEMSETIVDIAVADGRFTTLVTAVTEAGLAETLSGEGPFTVFAPTDDAFAALPEGTIPALLEDPQGALTDILLYHVVDGAVMAETVVTLESATTLNGADVTITVNDDGVFLNDTVQVIITDIVASNGVIHVIDGVLLPPEG